ncbi:eukaryotic rRNA processing protein EBP2-domain-containing protein [Russula compacta]|nr:eukaryotic rRNA processing protein EBP2-domain-containing protein [Russula compacta]
MTRRKIISEKSSSRPKAEDINGEEKFIDPPLSEDVNVSENDETGDDEDSGVDDEGLQNLARALGEDGLDEFDLAQLRTLTGAADGEESGGGEEDSGDGEEDGADTQSMSEDEEGEQVREAGEGIALDDEDVDSVDEDAVPRRKVEVDNEIALQRIRDAIKLDSSLPWTETLTVSFPESIDVDVNDDLNRELAFYKQALHGAKAARALAADHHLPFTRPDDFFAEMVKTDAHMERIRQRLLDESAGIAKSEARRREREGKKIGKQVQLEKLKERERSKKDMEERLKSLKRKHKGALHNAQAEAGDDDDVFGVAVEDAITDRPTKRARGRGGKAGGGSLPRHVRDKKFGFGGHGKRDKQNTRSSTDDLDGIARRGRGGGVRGRGRGQGGKGSRLGKSRRAAAR